MRLVAGLLVSAVLSLHAGAARAECSCVAVAGDVAAAIQAEVAKADGLYARGDFKAALDIYVRAYASSKDAALLYAQGMASWQLGMADKAKASFEAYLAAGGALLYKDRAEALLRGLGAGAAAGGVGLVGGLGGAARGVGGAVGGVGGAVGGLGVGAVGAAATGVEGGVGMVGGVATDLKPKKPGRKVGIVLGVVAIAAIGAVGIHSIAAGVSSDIELDPKFDLGLGISGVAVGISAIYVAGITSAAAVAAPTCTVGLPSGKPLVAPVALPGGGGLAAAMSF